MDFLFANNPWLCPRNYLVVCEWKEDVMSICLTLIEPSVQLTWAGVHVNINLSSFSAGLTSRNAQTRGLVHNVNHRADLPQGLEILGSHQREVRQSGLLVLPENFSQLGEDSLNGSR